MSDRPERDPLVELRHDMRTPINQIIGYAELLKEESAEPSPASPVEDLDRILKAARNLLGLINENLVRERLEGVLAGLAGPGHGTALDATLDATLAHAPAATLAHAPAPAPTSARRAAADDDAPVAVTGYILVVDDILENREMLARRLERQGHRTAVAADGLAALKMVGEEKYDLVLLDILMPGLDGRTVLERMKADAALRHIPVIMISAVDEIESVVRCIEAGAEDYLPKPFDPVILRARIGACLEKKALRDQEQRHLKTIEETQKRLTDELTEASNYVRSILPAPVTGAISTDWRLIPSTELGGDAFGYHWVDADHLAVYLLDVCGHGVGAALLSVTAIKVLLSAALPGVDFRDPGAVLTALNEPFLMEKQNDMYFTIWYGVIARRTGTLSYASAGHPPSLLVVPGGPVQELGEKAMVLGGFEGTVYRSSSVQMPAGSKLYLLSDGTFEVTRADGTMLELEDVAKFLESASAQGESELDALVAWVREQNGPGALDDDFSILKVRV